MSATSNSSAATDSFLAETLLFITFFVLKVTGYLKWSWWWITAPLWLPLAVVIAVVVVVAVIAFFVHIFGD